MLHYTVYNIAMCKLPHKCPRQFHAIVAPLAWALWKTICNLTVTFCAFWMMLCHS